MTYQTSQADFFGATPALPPGFQSQPELISAEQEQKLIARFATLPFKPFEFHGFLGKRRTVSYGWRYDFNGGALQHAEPIPGWLQPLRERAAALAQAAADDVVQVLLNQYLPGAPIGWHRD